MKLIQRLLLAIIIFHSSSAQNGTDYSALAIPLDRVKISDSSRKDHKAAKTPSHFLLLLKKNKTGSSDAYTAVARKIIPNTRIGNLKPHECIFNIADKSTEESKTIHNSLTTTLPDKFNIVDSAFIELYSAKTIGCAVNTLEHSHYLKAKMKPPLSNEIHDIMSGYTEETTTYKKGSDKPSKQLIKNIKEGIKKHLFTEDYEDTSPTTKSNTEKKRIPFKSPYLEVVSAKKPKKGCCSTCLPLRKRKSRI